jgi:hypothetical protein
MDIQLGIRMARGVKVIERDDLVAQVYQSPAVTHYNVMKYKGKPEPGSVSITLMDLII